MKTNSLRIGNYVLHAGKVIAVTSVFPKGINAHTDRITGKVSYIHADQIEPIPLSTDMLQRLGMRRNAVRWVKYGVDNLYVDRAVDKFTYPSAGLASGYVRCGSFISFKIYSPTAGAWNLNYGGKLFIFVEKRASWVVDFHKTHPLRFGVLAALVAEQRLHSENFDDSACGYLLFAPLED